MICFFYVLSEASCALITLECVVPPWMSHYGLVMQPSENLYDQAPAEIQPEPVAPALTSGGMNQSAPRSSRFVYMDDSPPESVSDSNSNSNTGHVAAPSTPADFFSEFGSSPIRPSYGSGRSKAQACYLIPFMSDGNRYK